MDLIVSHGNMSDKIVPAMGKVAIFWEGERKNITCVIRNVNPLPTVIISIGQQNYVNDFEKTESENVHCAGNAGSKDCPLHHDYDVILTTNFFEPLWVHDGQDLVCTSKLPGSGLEPVKESVRMDVRCMYPVILSFVVLYIVYNLHTRRTK